VSDAKTDDISTVEIHHKGQIVEVICYPIVGDITNPNLVDSGQLDSYDQILKSGHSKAIGGTNKRPFSGYSEPIFKAKSFKPVTSHAPGLDEEVQFPGAHPRVFLPDFLDYFQQLLLFVHSMQIAIQALMKRLLSDSYGSIHSVHFDFVSFTVCPEPLEGVEKYFFLISIPYSCSASSIIFSRKSMRICF